MATARPRNILLVARREFLVRGRTRSFRVATLLVVLGGLLVALLPIVIRFVEGDNSGDKVGIVAPVDLGFDAVAGFNAVLDVPSLLGSGQSFAFSTVDTEAQARAAVRGGGLSAAVLLARTATGDLDVTIVTKDAASARAPTLLTQGASAIAIQDRLARQGLTPAQQAALFATPHVTVEKPDATTSSTQTGAGEVVSMIVGQVLVVFIFVAILLYGQWVAMSVAEEKSSRVIEIVINAASPSELLGGKVLGVGALGLVQYVAAVIPAGLGLVFQGQIASLLLGASGSQSSGSGLDLAAAGLTPTILLAFGVFFILGFTLYAVLYAAAGSLVSRMEDVNSVVGPMYLIGMAGYFVAVYTATGLIPSDAPWLVVFSYVPFASPFLMLTRVMLGTAGLGEVALAVAILLVSIVAALWVAARVYSAGVLMYGQKAGFRTFLRTAFGRQP